MKREEERGKREEERGKREEGRGKRKEERGKREKRCMALTILESGFLNLKFEKI
ncbi:hypothetical protein [Proteiniphilum sp. X52]|uniref:hypothetical protein n=1 Tax=Proteiniphilum sp. X52 TaxID=2382159 RepID=UPI0013146EC3|nr:hypothetical protein [Proteiniphilum sp. X52]